MLQRKLALKTVPVHPDRLRTLLDEWILPRHKRLSTKNLGFGRID
jgi:hypothetical protein